MPNSLALLVQTDEGLVFPVVDLIRRIYRRLHLKSQIPCEFGWSQAPRRQQEHPEPLGSLGLNGAGDEPVDYVPTGERWFWWGTSLLRGARKSHYQSILLAEPLGSLAFIMVQVRQLRDKRKVEAGTAGW
ncbi:hypothetical protein F511_29398 [Dorcoceras hygrometricum]|uniref:Uncharacterized protein n=1 Tax=Dorcoceras hygrometricum TaxID=472368 RepID=A0A2Z7C1N6_9LAMI|nr:hypothetical protein F511_29398 [Dorcoceras hygrometricum]